MRSKIEVMSSNVNRPKSVVFLTYKYKTSKFYLQLKFTINSIILVVKIIIRTISFLIPITNIISSFEVSLTAHAVWLSLKTCFYLLTPSVSSCLLSGYLIKSIQSLTHICLSAFQPLCASWDMDRPRVLGALANSIRMGLTGGRSLVICSTGLLSGQAPSGTLAGGRSCRVCGAPRPRRLPSSAGLKMGRGRLFL